MSATQRRATLFSTDGLRLEMTVRVTAVWGEAQLLGCVPPDLSSVLAASLHFFQPKPTGFWIPLVWVRGTDKSLSFVMKVGPILAH